MRWKEDPSPWMARQRRGNNNKARNDSRKLFIFVCRAESENGGCGDSYSIKERVIYRMASRLGGQVALGSSPKGVLRDNNVVRPGTTGEVYGNTIGR